MIPCLETDRLKLRGHEISDYDACLAMWSDPNVVRFIGGKPSTPQQVWQRILTYRGHWELMGFGYWAVTEKSTGHFVGELGFADFKRDLTPSIHGVAELGWAITPSMQGKGHATEALRAVQAWGDAKFSRARTVCIIQPENEISIRVAAKIGFVNPIDAIHAGARTLLFSRP